MTDRENWRRQLQPGRPAVQPELQEPDEVQQAIEQANTTPNYVLPLTGEVIDLHDPAQVAHGLDELREIKRLADETRGFFVHLLRAESERQGTKTLHLGDLDCVLVGGTKTVYDVEKLAGDLQAAGLPHDRLLEAVQPIVTYKVDQRVLRQLEAANPAYAKAIQANRREEPAPWNATIKRRKG